MIWRRLLAWKIEFDEHTVKELKKLGPEIQREILRYLKERVAPSDNPRISGKALVGTFSGLWRYRLGKYRIVCQIKDDEAIILILRIGHRKDIYI
jgi:mRNA interferase RelE/StbE